MNYEVQINGECHNVSSVNTAKSIVCNKCEGYKFDRIDFEEGVTGTGAKEWIAIGYYISPSLSSASREVATITEEED